MKKKKKTEKSLDEYHIPLMQTASKHSFIVIFQAPAEMVRDIFLCGVLNHHLRERFYKEGGDLTVQKMIHIVDSYAKNYDTTGSLDSVSVKSEPLDDDQDDNFDVSLNLSFSLCVPLKYAG